MKLKGSFFCIFWCFNLVTSSPVLSEDVEEQNLEVKSQPSVQVQGNVLEGALALGLMGGAMALFSKKEEPQGVDRQGLYDPVYGVPRHTYAQRVNDFERRVVSKISNGLSGVTHNARRVTGRIRNTLRRAGQRSLGVLRRGGDAISRMASNTDRSLRGMARTATRGLRRISSRVSRVGAGSIERMGTTTSNVPGAALRGLIKVGRSYVRGLDRARKNAVNGLRRFGTTYKRGISRIGNTASHLASAYTRGVARMGSAAKTSLSDVASDGVSRLGQLASDGVATIGDLATDVADVAVAVPKSLGNVVQDKKMRDCVLQAMCYISTPFIDPNSNYVKRNAEENNEEIVDLTKEESEKIRVEDCEAFQCRMVSFGRQAYDLLRSSSQK